MKMSPDEVGVMTQMQPQALEANYVDRWPSVVQSPIKDEQPMIGTQQSQDQQHLVNSDVISMQYMELEEFLLENSVPDGTGKVFADNTHEKHYHVSLEQRGLLGNNTSQQQYTDIPNNHGNNNVHLLSIHQHHGVPHHHHDPNSPPQSGCDSPPSLQYDLLPSPRSANTQNGNSNHTSNNQGTTNINHLSNTARKSLPRRVSTSSNTSSLVVTPPHTPQQPSPPISESMSDQVKPRRAVKRSRKESVPDDNKDDKYWRRRAKNNAAAKRSRDLRREKESHIMQRVAFLEKENRILHQEMDSIKMENEELKERLARYENNRVLEI